ncbi:predicted protein [Aspergillus nidulans FGSC A4]|nr:predicted protein [Aspergillus nidulans FGSC A4]|eukprot:XP_868836.1 predicted protein [Aspergillus nidulans FGSC A4]
MAMSRRSIYKTIISSLSNRFTGINQEIGYECNIPVAVINVMIKLRSFHGLHVIIGTAFLAVDCSSSKRNVRIISFPKEYSLMVKLFFNLTGKRVG